MLFDKILFLASKHSFFSPVFSKDTKNVVNYLMGHSGSLFKSNIKTEWIYSNVINRDVSVFMYTFRNRNDVSLNQNYLNARDLCDKCLPFGIAEIFNDNLSNDNSNALDYFSCTSPTILSSSMYIPSTESMQYYFHWQRQRKLWWKKISAFPGRFQLGEITSCPSKTSVNILAEFPWGNQVLETVSLNNVEAVPDADLTVNFGQKSVLPTVVKSELSLETAVVALFCDALDEETIDDAPVLRLHRKLTPHKCIFATTSDDVSLSDELSQLAFYLTKQIRKVGLTTVLLPDCTKSSLAVQFQRNDEWGIPYTVVLNENSLKSGIVGLRNRDTTLQEEVHVSDLTTYMAQLFKNF